MSTSNARYQLQRTATSMRRGRALGIVALAGFCLLGAVAAPAQAATVSLHAAPSAAGTADCSSMANACSIATAVTNANAASVADSVRIALAGGTYSLPAPTPTALNITFAGPSLTIEAESGAPVLDGTDTARLLSVGATSKVTIDGLELRDGATTALGGGIDNRGTLTVIDSTFSSNRAANGGAIANNAGATLKVIDSTFSANTATGLGGGAIISLGAATVQRSTFSANSAPVDGGAINVQTGGTVTVTSSTIAGNTSGTLGGGLANLGTLTVQGSTIANNTSAGGAAIATGNTNVTFAATIVAAQTSGAACSPVNTAIVDGGYNLDTDGTCISETTPATGSHSGQTAYGSSTYGAVLGAYLADGLADNGGLTDTFALLNSPNPSTSLANPAFDVVPASFQLPVAVDGKSAACSVGDQRGVVPVAQAGCAIGAYLLQATKTALATPAAVVNAPVTLTAAVTPAADGGTVSFNDGAGNPATANCGAQSVSNGTATCTVTYTSAGQRAVTATYTGDGAGNNFVGSVSTTQTVVVAAAPVVVPPIAGPPVVDPPAVVPPVATKPDRTPPTTTIRRVKVKQPITLRGTAKDAGSVRSVGVSVARHVGRRCRFLRKDGTFTKARSCRKNTFLNAKGTTTWSLKLASLPKGRYTIWSRGLDAAGNIEGAKRGRNLIALRIPAR
jgi:predicted outer membrane repeat protein